MSTRLCHDFLWNADWAWRSIRAAHATGLSFSEETITETILLQLKIRNHSRLLIKPFTKKEERLNGADWEWWIGRDGNWIGMRVQAKRITLPDETYKSIFYKAKKANQMQIDYLIKQAQKANPPLIPIYTLYTYSNNLPVLRKQCFHCFRKRYRRFFNSGCLVAHAQDVLAEGSIKLSNIAPFAFPWHCLVCECQQQGNGSSGPADHIASLFRRTAAEVGEDFADRPSRFLPDPVRELPQHIQLLRSGDDPQGRNFEKYAEEWNLGGIAVFDLEEGIDE